ncbi:MAG: hypothetical protein PWR03_866 [Tenuifilum sp.]|jgi:hypothetical protein|nr:hypothetical protein [Tenuifilum sp.]
MRKKLGFSIVEQAIVLVPEFEKIVRKLEKQRPLRNINCKKYLKPSIST